jgi:predicted RNA binding protein YcfA (HicA-like mRNA interferase family)
MASLAIQVRIQGILHHSSDSDEGSRFNQVDRIEGLADGRQKGSHRSFEHPTKPSVVTVPGHSGDELPTGTLKSVLRKAEIER